MCACQQGFVCSRCRAIDQRDWDIQYEPDEREQDEQRRYADSRRRPEDEQ